MKDADSTDSTSSPDVSFTRRVFLTSENLKSDAKPRKKSKKRESLKRIKLSKTLKRSQVTQKTKEKRKRKILSDDSSDESKTGDMTKVPYKDLSSSVAGIIIPVCSSTPIISRIEKKRLFDSDICLDPYASSSFEAKETPNTTCCTQTSLFPPDKNNISGFDTIKKPTSDNVFCNTQNMNEFFQERAVKRPKMEFSKTISSPINYFQSHFEDALYRGYQLLGDSQFVRFSKQVLKLATTFVKTERRSVAKIGFCVSGQKIGDLLKNLTENQKDIKRNVIILIGTNDLNQGTPADLMIKQFEMLLKLLKINNVKRIVVLTVPPIPYKCYSASYQWSFKKYNSFLETKHNDRDIYVVDIASLFFSWNNKICETYFEKYYANGNSDMLHLNLDGLKLLKAVVDIKYFDHAIKQGRNETI